MTIIAFVRYLSLDFIHFSKKIKIKMTSHDNKYKINFWLEVKTFNIPLGM